MVTFCLSKGCKYGDVTSLNLLTKSLKMSEIHLLTKFVQVKKKNAIIPPNSPTSNGIMAMEKVVHTINENFRIARSIG